MNFSTVLQTVTLLTVVATCVVVLFRSRKKPEPVKTAFPTAMMEHVTPDPEKVAKKEDVVVGRLRTPARRGPTTLGGDTCVPDSNEKAMDKYSSEDEREQHDVPYQKLSRTAPQTIKAAKTDKILQTLAANLQSLNRWRREAEAREDQMRAHLREVIKTLQDASTSFRTTSFERLLKEGEALVPEDMDNRNQKDAHPSAERRLHEMVGQQEQEEATPALRRVASTPSLATSRLRELRDMIRQAGISDLPRETEAEIDALDRELQDALSPGGQTEAEETEETEQSGDTDMLVEMIREADENMRPGPTAETPNIHTYR